MRALSDEEEPGSRSDERESGANGDRGECTEREESERGVMRAGRTERGTRNEEWGSGIAREEE